MPTIGVAVAVPEPFGSELQAYRSALGDETADRIPTHITLVPPLDLGPDDEALSEVERHLADVAGRVAAFTVHLRGTGSFRPVSPVVFVSLVEGIAGCERLAGAVRRGPLDVDLAFPYHPHVTVAHHLPDPLLDRAADELADFDCRLHVTAFDLYVHDERRGWEPTRSFTLQGQDSAADTPGGARAHDR